MGFERDATSATLKIRVTLHPHTSVWYQLNVEARGPAGLAMVPQIDASKVVKLKLGS